MRDTVTAPGLSGEASGCGAGVRGGGRHNRGGEGGTVGARRAAGGGGGTSGIPVRRGDPRRFRQPSSKVTQWHALAPSMCRALAIAEPVPG